MLLESKNEAYSMNLINFIGWLNIQYHRTLLILVESMYVNPQKLSPT
jgi:hypothetical protein